MPQIEPVTPIVNRCPECGAPPRRTAYDHTSHTTTTELCCSFTWARKLDDEPVQVADCTRSVAAQTHARKALLAYFDSCVTLDTTLTETNRQELQRALAELV